MRNFISSIILILIAANLIAQSADHFCGHQHVMNKIEQRNSSYSKQFHALTDEFNSNRNFTEFGPCTVNVVVHIVYFNDVANVSDIQVFNQIDILNKRLNHLNSDTSLLRDQFLPITGNPSGIFFQLAEIDPLGNPTNGILRVQTNRDGFGSSNEFLSEGVKSTSEGGSSAWDTQRYLNIWVCDTKDETGMPTVAGYAIPPANLPNWPGGFEDIVDGVVIQWDYFGDDNDNLGKVAVHEVGHYFGLRHIWGDDLNCTGDDGINDTPSAADYSYFLCSQNSNTCEDNINGEDLFDMVENYMDYSFPGCQVAFTNDQNAFMNWVFENYRPQLCWDVTAIDKLNSLKIEVFPQPASTFINTGLMENNPFRIINMAGQIVQSGQLNNGIITWNYLPNGLYLLSIGEVNQRFIVINP
jgi:hypothetical protein